MTFCAKVLIYHFHQQIKKAQIRKNEYYASRMNVMMEFSRAFTNFELFSFWGGGENSFFLCVKLFSFKLWWFRWLLLIGIKNFSFKLLSAYLLLTTLGKQQWQSFQIGFKHGLGLKLCNYSDHKRALHDLFFCYV